MQVTIDGLKIEYEVIGTGDPVLLLHGWGANMDTMRPIAEHFTKLGKRAVMMDFPGFGKSDVPNAPIDMLKYASITRQFIELNNLRGADCICHSFGGRVAIILASEDSSLFDKLILIDAAGIKPKRRIGYYYRVYAYKLGRNLSRCVFANKLLHLDDKLKNAGSDDYKALNGSMRETFKNVVNLDLSDKLDKIQNETLLIWGSDDTATPMYMAKLMEKKIKHSGLAVIEGAGHYSYLENFPKFCAIIDALYGMRGN